ncbi:Dipeptidyl-peptidase 6 [Shimia thalassica]|uniref:Dipeptidyl-peptidase 6 n=1 Tax=Shimia thalassica TaxID=1715693 RepID=A0A0N7M9U1_9RHOB|nr:NlpC/P60 family protein [Shimia thalassica]CUK03512.1 Dipeptidyl-peptidase 6 [Shimia thalassica]
MDRRLLKSNGHVAHVSLVGQVDADRFVEGERFRITTATAPILQTPNDTGRDREMLFGDDFIVLDEADDHVFGFSERDGYVGYTPRDALAKPSSDVTHVVQVRQSYGKSSAALKQRDEVLLLHHGARLCVKQVEDGWAECDWPRDRGEGSLYLPAAHLSPIGALEDDPARVAERYLGAYYLWGGNSSVGIDCSGLVQAALMACGIPCPGDSDMQKQALGHPVPQGSPYERGDILFWKGHVAMVVNSETLIHANAHHMAVAYEPIAEAIARIAAQGDGDVTAHKRLERR